MSIQDKSLIVTGAGSGIGAATAIAAATIGALVMLADRDEESIKGVCSEITSRGGVAKFMMTDIAIEAQVERLVLATVDSFGKVDCAFNNAGISAYSHRDGNPHSPLAELTAEAFNHNMSVNALGTFLCMKHELKVMQQFGGGSIVNTSSIAGWLAVPGAADYVASKHAVIGLTKAAALDYAKDNIRVNAVLPGVIKTKMLAAAFEVNPELNDWVIASQPTGSLGAPDDISDAVLWLLSDAAKFVTGVSLPVDGGYSMV